MTPKNRFFWFQNYRHLEQRKLLVINTVTGEVIGSCKEARLVYCDDNIQDGLPPKTSRVLNATSDMLWELPKELAN